MVGDTDLGRGPLSRQCLPETILRYGNMLMHEPLCNIVFGDVAFTELNHFH